MFAILNNIIEHLEDGILNEETRVTELDLSNRNLKKLPDLSKYINLKKLNISYNQLTSIDDIPNSIEELDCCSNYIVKLPEHLPSKLRILNCFLNELVVLPISFPITLNWLNCSSNSIENIVGSLPKDLKYFNCSDNYITSFSELRNGLIYFDYSYNYLLEPPILPLDLETVYVYSKKSLKSQREEYTFEFIY
jgi:Leucine-rich repeat (LRR) protein